MISTARKTILTTVILTAAFALVLVSRSFLGPDESGALEFIGLGLMGVAVVACAIIWSRGPAAINDDS